MTKKKIIIYLDLFGMILMIFSIIIAGLIIISQQAIFILALILVIIKVARNKELLKFKLQNNFFEIYDSFEEIQENNIELNEIYRKTISFIRDIELVNFGLNM